MKKPDPKHHQKKVKDHLKTMSKNSRGHKMRTAGRIVKYGTASFARNIWLSIAATLVMTVTLIILFVTVLASIILSSTADTMREKIDITIFFKPATTIEELNQMSETMSRDSNVRSVEVADAQTEYQRFLDENKTDTELITTLKDPDMEALMIESMQATMRIKVNDLNNLDSIKNIVATDQQFIDNLDENKVPTYDVNQAEIETVRSWANIAKNGGLILGAVFLVISILVIFNTIRMAIFSRREEIYMMKLVGADSSFIRGPFLIEAQMCGIISGLLASTAGFFGFKFLAPKLTAYGIDVSAISNIIESEWLVAVYVVMILVGILIGSISARLAISRYLH